MFYCISEGEVTQTIVFDTLTAGLTATGGKTKSYGVPTVTKSALVWEKGQANPFSKDGFKDDYDILAFTPDLTGVNVNMRVLVDSVYYLVSHIEDVAKQGEVFLTYMKVIK